MMLQLYYHYTLVTLYTESYFGSQLFILRPALDYSRTQKQT